MPDQEQPASRGFQSRLIYLTVCPSVILSGDLLVTCGSLAPYTSDWHTKNAKMLPHVLFRKICKTAEHLNKWHKKSTYTANFVAQGLHKVAPNSEAHFIVGALLLCNFEQKCNWSQAALWTSRDWAAQCWVFYDILIPEKNK